ncbi:hypothetical protein [Sulfurimonas sp.]|uniref:hypothetical protein n=1 Tax=Sulfurimonas sp. TaxID=2022749 RepID=UPI0026274554|nr:hypothetical protein [Sulfurimonas sp.]
MYPKTFFIPLLFCSTLFANESCYSVSLYSSSQEQKFNFPSECKMLHIGNYYTLRCGCYKDNAQAKNALKNYKPKYKDAYVTLTRRSRFKEKIPKKVKPRTSFEYKYDFNATALTLLPKLSNAVLSEDNSLKSSIKQYTKLLQKQEEKIQTSSDFFGLSIDAKYDQYFSQDYINRDYTDYEYNLKIQYDIFKNGYYQHKKDKQLRLAKSKIFAYQNLINLQKFNLEENLANLDKLSDTINEKYYEALGKMYTDALKRSSQLFKEGALSKEKIQKLSHKIKKYLALEKIYKNNQNITIDKNIYHLLLKIDTLRLKKEQNIQNQAKTASYESNIQNAHIDLAKESKSFRDDVVFNVYASQRGVDEVGYYQTVGTQIKVPLNFSSSEEKELEKLQISALNLQKQAINNHINTSIQNLYQNFEKTKAVIQVNQLDNKNLEKELQAYQTIAKYYIAELNIDFEEKILRLQEEILKNKYESMLQRIQALKIILQLSSLTNIYDFNNLVED